MDQHKLPEVPFPGPEAGKSALRSLVKTRNLLRILEAVHREMGDIFRIPMPGFKPIFLVGPEANKFMIVSNRNDFRWRNENDPVTRLLRNGLLVTDEGLHDGLRHAMLPALHKQSISSYFQAMLYRTDQVIAEWKPGDELDMLEEMRKIALLIIMDTLFGIDFSPAMNELWEDIKGVLRYISPGIWIIHPGIPRPVYKKSIHHIYAYFDQVIKERRSKGGEGEDLLSRLASDPGFSDDLIRDQMLTLFIAGHDTSTAALTWSLFLLASHPQVLARVKNEIEREAGKDIPCLAVVNRLDYLEMVIKESLRLYPPIHIGNRVAAKEILFQGYRIPEGTRVVYSIYLTHRHPGYWTRPDEFIPERFDNQLNPKPVPYSYLPFGGGPRNCIGMAFAMVELKLVLARIFQKFDLNFHSQRADQVVPYMGATLEPRPGVFLRISKSA